MKLLLFLAVVASGLTWATLQAEAESHPRSYLNSPLRIVAQTSSGRDYKKREYTSYTWLIKNVDVSNVWLPLPKDRSQSKSMPIKSFLYRTRVSAGWTSRRLGDHEVNYEADWVILPPGEKYELFTITFYEEDERFKEVEVSLTYKDAAGKIHKERLSYSASASSYRGRDLESLVVDRVAPEWPPEHGMIVAGDVAIRITLDAGGMLRSARAISGHPMKRAAAIAAVRSWKFRPLIERGKARTVRGIVTVRFPDN